MRYFRATTAQGVEYYRATHCEEITCACVIYPLDEGGLFPEVTIDWYTHRGQCERHARDWRGHGHAVEILDVVPVPAEEYASRTHRPVDTPATIRL